MNQAAYVNGESLWIEGLPAKMNPVLYIGEVPRFEGATSPRRYIAVIHNRGMGSVGSYVISDEPESFWQTHTVRRYSQCQVEG